MHDLLYPAEAKSDDNRRYREAIRNNIHTATDRNENQEAAEGETTPLEYAAHESSPPMVGGKHNTA
jgi:hypothetical protein